MLQSLKFLLILSFFIPTAMVSAQGAGKYGHMNLGNLLETLPDSKKADTLLQVFMVSYTTKGDSLGKAMEAAAAKFQQEYQAGLLTAVVAQEQYATLEKQQAELEKFEQDAQQKIGAKRDELLKPILEKLYDAINAVGKENGYLMIFDTSTGATLFALETEDVTPLVKKKLGI